MGYGNNESEDWFGVFKNKSEDPIAMFNNMTQARKYKTELNFKSSKGWKKLYCVRPVKLEMISCGINKL